MLVKRVARIIKSTGMLCLVTLGAAISGRLAFLAIDRFLVGVQAPIMITLQLSTTQAGNNNGLPATADQGTSMAKLMRSPLRIAGTFT
jgi:hypothetical protein